MYLLQRHVKHTETEATLHKLDKISSKSHFIMKYNTPHTIITSEQLPQLKYKLLHGNRTFRCRDNRMTL